MNDTPQKPPPPGSDEALDAGCCCPVLDNGHGRGCGRVDSDGNAMYWVNEHCPLHGGATATEITTQSED